MYLSLSGGRDEDCWHQPREDILRTLYRKHGWPGENLDGDAFLVDYMRHKHGVKYMPKEVWPSLKDLVEKREQDKTYAMEREQTYGSRDG